MLSETVVASGITVKVKDDAGKVLGEYVPQDGVVVFDKLSAAQLSKKIYVAVYNGKTAVSNTLRYSVESYAARMKYSTEGLGNLLVSMMKYGDSAGYYIATLK